MSEMIGREFMEKTKYQYLPESDQQQGLPQPPLEKAWPEGGTVIDLPDPRGAAVQAVDLTAAIGERRSERAYADAPLTLAELSYLLWATQGVRETTQRPATLRTVPSAGSRHPFETYVLVNNVEGLEPGLNYIWRVVIETDDGSLVSETVTCQAPVCPADIQEEVQP